MGTARVTFIINESGVIEEIIGKVDTKNHIAQILKDKSAAAEPPAKKPVKKVASKKITKKSIKKSVKPTVKKVAKKKK